MHEGHLSLRVDPQGACHSVGLDAKTLRLDVADPSLANGFPFFAGHGSQLLDRFPARSRRLALQIFIQIQILEYSEFARRIEHEDLALIHVQDGNDRRGAVELGSEQARILVEFPPRRRTFLIGHLNRDAERKGVSIMEFLGDFGERDCGLGSRHESNVRQPGDGCQNGCC